LNNESKSYSVVILSREEIIEAAKRFEHHDVPESEDEWEALARKVGEAVWVSWEGV